MNIVPDSKDWTWVLHSACPECGLDTRQLPREGVAGLLRANAGRWLVVLDHSVVRDRPAPGVWSPLEYACHVRDVFLRFAQRLDLMLTEQDPLFPNWDQDATAIEQRYDRQDPAEVARELSEAAETLAIAFEQVSGPLWERTGRRSDGASFTVETFGRYFIHDPIHHLYDVTGRRHGEEG
ncbi:MAG: methyltransferase type 12 [Pseudonocardiales bacterium]|nr:MAG: methyltransferase type 12 [Pseudonocardiales bacterium]